LQRLGLSYNKITDISVLKGMELKYLALAGNNITDYSPVEGLYIGLNKNNLVSNIL